ncbi:MAG TPA: hypothetical protein VGR28_14540 [Candidatus Thermoplasmatota archaeon]|nr:hypothetical protein [Candidatus Thermoplasmatota archaeon]
MRLRMFAAPRAPTEDPDARGAKLNARRRHLRAQMADNQRVLRVLWTDYRNTSDRRERRGLKQHIRRAEAQRKALAKDMRKLQSEMLRLGFRTVPGEVDA